MSEPTKGPWMPCADDVSDCDWEHPTHSNMSTTTRAICGAAGHVVAFAVTAHHEWFNHAADAEMEANANLIAEAGTVYDETGLTPRQMQERYEQMRKALDSIVECCEEHHAARDYASRQSEIRGIARSALANTERKTT